jgi:hypothetical protein
MTSMERRIQKLEKRLIPSPEVALRHKELVARIEAGRERVRKAYEEWGISPPSDKGLPPKKVHTSHGTQRIMDILNEGRDRAHLRSVRDKKLRESGRLATGDERCP